MSCQLTNYDWQFYAETKTACKGMAKNCTNCSFWPRGKVLGGSSAINQMIYVRGNKRDFDLWASKGNKGWDYESVLPFFKKSEANHFLPFVYKDNGRYHSNTGPLNIDYCGYHSIDRVFVEAGMENGYPYLDDINANQYIGYLNTQGTCYGGRRQSTAKAFLVPIKKRSNLHIVKHGLVKKVCINKKRRAYAIKYERNGKTIKAYAKKEVILSAGSIMNPVIMMLSGVGPKEHLKEHNIRVKCDLAVGQNLIDHIYSFVLFKFDPTLSILDELDVVKTYELAIHNSGLLLECVMSMAFINTNKSAEFPNIELMHLYFPQNYKKFDLFNQKIIEKLHRLNKKYDIGSSNVILLQPKSRGYIHLNGSSIHNKPIIEAGYFSVKEDLETLITAVRQQVSHVKSNAFRKKNGKFIESMISECEGIEFDTNEYWECYISHLSQTIYHPVGTCKMGPICDSDAVVDDRLRVHGIDGLRVIDASM